MIRLYCISISYKNADAEIRKRFAFSKELQDKILLELTALTDISQCVILCTCNRTELYFCSGRSAFGTVMDKLAEYGGTESSMILRCAMIYGGDGALFHLFKVSCGIESMVIGEDEILRQTKTAYNRAAELGTVSYELNMTFQAAFSCAKKIKTVTAISKTPVSIATLASNKASERGGNVLVIGASGETGSSVLKNLLSHKNVNVAATLRKHNPGILKVSDKKVEVIDYDRRYEYINKADCVVSATSGPHYTVSYRAAKDHIICDKRRLFLDLAMPPDIDKNIMKIHGSELYGIDYFESLAAGNNAVKLDCVDSAEIIIWECIEALKKEFLFHGFMPHMEAVGKNVEREGFESLLFCLKSELDAKSFGVVLDSLRKFGKKD